MAGRSKVAARSLSLYAVLNVAEGASAEEITRAYRRLALQYHPDRNPAGTEQFKHISNAYAVLGDALRRSLYDSTGVVSEAEEDAGKVTQARSSEVEMQVQSFFESYAGSEEEIEDVCSTFVKCKGNFRTMVREHLLFDNGKDGEVRRLDALVARLVKTGRLTETEAWLRTSTPAALRALEKNMRREREQAEVALREMGLESSTAAAVSSGEEGAAATTSHAARSSRQSSSGGGGGDLAALQALIQQRQQSSWSRMVSDIEQKYVKSATAASSPSSAKATSATHTRCAHTGKKKNHPRKK